MQYTTLGKTGLKVSVAGLGCGGFSRFGLGTGKSEAEAARSSARRSISGSTCRHRARPTAPRRARQGDAGRPARPGRHRHQGVVLAAASAVAAEHGREPRQFVAASSAPTTSISTSCTASRRANTTRRSRSRPRSSRRGKGQDQALGMTETALDDPEHEMLRRAARGRRMGRRHGRVPHDAPERAQPACSR